LTLAITETELRFERSTTRGSFRTRTCREIVGRGNSTTDVLVQLGVDYQNLPGIALAGYQCEVTALSAKLTLLNSLVDQIRPVLVDIDELAQPMHEKNIRALGILRSALRNDADIALLDQITGPTPQPPSPPTPPGP
jgi:hypothetical protein